MNQENFPKDYDPFESLVDSGLFEADDDVLNVRWNEKTKKYEDLLKNA